MPDRVSRVASDVVSPAGLWQAFAPLIAGQPVYRTMNADQHYLQSSERAIGASLPARPAAVLVYSPDGFARTLCLDFDSGRVSDEDFERELVEVRLLLHECGLGFVEDVSPSRGRHVYVPLERPVPATRARAVVEALGRRFRSLDPSPHRSVRSGCIRVPGSRHKSRGWQELVTSFGEAQRVFAAPNDAAALERLCVALSDELKVEPSPTPAPTTRVQLPLGVPSSGGLGPVAQEVARDGGMSADRYQSPSEARMGALCSLVSSGWSFADVRHELSAGSLPGLAALYARYKSPAVIDRTMAHEWEKASTFVEPRRSGQKSVRKSDINGPLTSQRGEALSGYGLVRESRMLMDLFDSRIGQGRETIYLKFVLRALLVFAQMHGTSEVAVGCRAIAIATGLHHGTVAKLLKRLTVVRQSPVKLVARGRGLEADQYRIELSDDDAELARRRGLAQGKIHALRPVFRALGPVTALVYEALERQGRCDVNALCDATGMSRATVYKALQVLHSHAMIENTGRGWKIDFTTNLTALADRLGVLDSVQRQINLYRKQRRQWAYYLASRPGSPDYQRPLAEHEVRDEEIEVFLSQEPPPDLIRAWEQERARQLREEDIYDHEIEDFLKQEALNREHELCRRAAQRYHAPSSSAPYWRGDEELAAVS